MIWALGFGFKELIMENGKPFKGKYLLRYEETSNQNPLLTHPEVQKE